MGPGSWPLPKGQGPWVLSSELDLKAETVEALAIRKLARTGTVTERAAARAARGPILRERRTG